MTVTTSISRLFVASLVLTSISFVSTEYVPVYIWESSKSNEVVPALPRISQETFKEIIQEKLDKKSFVVIFAEPNLSSEDFGAVDQSGNKVFSHLSSVKASRTYLPSVANPMDVLKSIHTNDISQTTVKEFDISNIKSSILIVDLDDVQDDEERNEILARHDKSINSIYKALQEKQGDVFAVYTAYHTSWIIPEEVSLVRQSRNVLQSPQPRADEDRHLWNATGFLLYVSNVAYLTLGQNNRRNLTNHIVTVVSANNESLVVSLTSTGEPGVNFIFRFAGGYWFLNNVTLVDTAREVNLRVRDINAPFGFSYQCTNTVFLQRNDPSTSLVLPGMQLQATRNIDLSQFGDPLYCVGFTTAPI
ncbi:hypothetical protein AMK59_5809, partial [Oryctes borbonicus]